MSTDSRIPVDQFLVALKPSLGPQIGSQVLAFAPPSSSQNKQSRARRMAALLDTRYLLNILITPVCLELLLLLRRLAAEINDAAVLGETRGR